MPIELVHSGRLVHDARLAYSGHSSRSWRCTMR